MRKLLCIVFSMLIIVGCSLTGNTPTKKTEEFLSRYKTMSEGVMMDLELSSEMSGLSTTEAKNKYIDVMKRQYSDMNYEVINEVIDGDEATVEVKISVYDMYKARSESEEYINNNESEFLTEGSTMRDTDKANDYILGELYKTEEKVEYTIYIELEKEDGKWEVEELDSETKEKIHGTYNYEAQ